MQFKVALPFSSQFNGSRTSWVSYSGQKYSVSSTALYTRGFTGMWSSVIRRIAEYGNFVFTARVKRETDLTAQNCMLVRGGSSISPTNYIWYPGYLFCYTNDGHYSILRLNSNGTQTTLQASTATGTILSTGWNTLKVSGSGSTLNFYINSTLLQTKIDATFASGLVGFQMEGVVGADRFLVDWATLTVP
jgi:hypothetical protein